MQQADYQEKSDLHFSRMESLSGNVLQSVIKEKLLVRTQFQDIQNQFQ